MRDFFDAFGTVTISGGSVEDFFYAHEGSTVTIVGGSVGHDLSDGTRCKFFELLATSEVPLLQQVTSMRSKTVHCLVYAMDVFSVMQKA